jgi:uncharacterized protein (DUF3820 family)
LFIIKIFVLYLNMFNTKTNIMTLRFGKYKGQQLENTPKSYQDWLMNQEWFKAPKKEIPLHRQSLNGWDGYSKWGQAIEDAIFANDCLDQDLTNDELYLKYN